jgi:hypothetical protein
MNQHFSNFPKCNIILYNFNIFQLTSFARLLTLLFYNKQYIPELQLK